MDHIIQVQQAPANFAKWMLSYQPEPNETALQKIERVQKKRLMNLQNSSDTKPHLEADIERLADQLAQTQKQLAYRRVNKKIGHVSHCLKVVNWALPSTNILPKNILNAAKLIHAYHHPDTLNKIKGLGADIFGQIVWSTILMALKTYSSCQENVAP